jgi:AraC family transcriptional regulator
MDNTSIERAQVNPHGERSLLNAELASRWEGYPIGWVEAAAHVEAGDSEVPRTTLAMLDCGQAQAEITRSRKSLRYDLGAGAMGLFVQGTPIRRLRWECRDVRRIMVEVDLARLPELSGLELPPTQPWQTDFEFHDDGLAAVLRLMAAEAASGAPNGPLYAQSLSLGVALRLHQRASQTSSLHRERGKLSTLQVQRIDEWIDAHLGQEITLQQLAGLAGFSPAHFVRLFRNTLGCAPYQHVLRRRLVRAHRLLLATDLPIAAIAGEIGFSSQSHLTSAFVRAYGTSPGQMRRQHVGVHLGA